MKLITTTKVALDSNVLVYLHDLPNSDRQRIAQSLLRGSPVVSAQAVSEYMNVAKRVLTHYSKGALVELCLRTLLCCHIQPVNVSTLFNAQKLIRKYDFQIFDAIIVMSALEARCNILYSEDMQHNRLVEGTLRILNPFKALPTKTKK
jgi:predicted nucleic acid-binding protein